MQYQTFQPTGELADIVEQIWCYDGYQPPHRFERVFPSGTVEVVINLTGDYLRCYDAETKLVALCRGPIVTGVHRTCFIVDTEQQRNIMGVHLKPGGAYRLFGVPASELAGAHIELEALFGADAHRLLDALVNTAQPRQRLRTLEAALRRRVRGRSHSAVTWAIEQFCTYPESARVGDVADEAGLSLRRFNELFTREVGINAKAFLRIRRFQATLARVRSGAWTTWATLATEMGFADQAHLTRDFREFSGLTPSAYIGLPTTAVDHVPIAERTQICPITELASA